MTNDDGNNWWLLHIV